LEAKTEQERYEEGVLSRDLPPELVEALGKTVLDIED
jgi:hypothetical protein